MVQLETRNRILEETITSTISAEKRTAIDVKVGDFDGAQYWLRSTRAQPDGPYDILMLSLSMPVYRDLKGLVAVDQVLKDTYGDLVVPADDSDVCLRMDLANIAPEHTNDLVQSVCRLREVVAGSPFSLYFGALSKNTQMTLKPVRFSLHPDCVVFLTPKNDRIVCVFSLGVRERSDAVITSVFLAEFAEGRRKVPSGPTIQFSTTPPKEVQDAFNIQKSIGNVGFVSFAILSNHVDTPTKVDAAAATFSGFRTFIQYHIKCSKAYFHSRMRARVVLLMKILNRAKIDQFDDGKDKKKKTFSGRTFEQKV